MQTIECAPGSDHWQPARLIPTSGINGQQEAERRATSALLAVMGAVREFGLAMLKPLGAPSGKLGTFIEIPFKAADRTVYPDGAVQVSRAGQTWTALIEVKTGSAELEREQVETYLDVARENGAKVVLTISNQLAPAHGVHPVEVDRRKLKRVALHHLSWAEILTVAVQQRVHRGISDPDQAWILGELIRYLEHPRSGALDFTDMGGTWVPIREAIKAGTLRANDKGLPEVVSRWEQLLRFAALRLGRELGAEVEVQVSRKEAADPTLRIASQAQALVANNVLTGALRIPDAIAPLDLVADLHAERVTVSIDLAAPREGRPLTRVNWLVRQLRDAPDSLRIDAFANGARTSTSELLGVVRADPGVLIVDSKRDLRSFRIAATSAAGGKRGVGRGGFIDSVLTAVDGFYEAVIQELRAWTAKAPQLPSGSKTAAEEAGIDIEPPIHDLLEPADASVSGHAPPEAPLPEPLLTGASGGNGDELLDGWPDRSGAAPSDPDLSVDEYVEWHAAQSRLDHERDVDNTSVSQP
jgi:hypothetical protein